MHFVTLQVHLITLLQNTLNFNIIHYITLQYIGVGSANAGGDPYKRHHPLCPHCTRANLANIIMMNAP